MNPFTGEIEIESGDGAAAAKRATGEAVGDGSKGGGHGSGGRDAVGFLLRGDVGRRRRVGRMCKRLVDLGRVQYLRSLGLHAELVYYCPADVSPENALLVAWRGGGQGQS